MQSLFRSSGSLKALGEAEANNGTKSPALTAAIQLDSEPVQLNGDAHEAEEVSIKGRVLVHTRSPVRTTTIKITLLGQYDIESSPLLANPSIDFPTKGFFHHDWQTIYDCTNERSSTLQAGDHVYPFEFKIPGQAIESIYCGPNTHFDWKLKLMVARGHLFSTPLELSKPIRVVRSFLPGSLSAQHSNSLAKIWPQKVSYELSTPRRAVVFGSTFSCDIRVMPLIENLTVNKITVRLIEKIQHQFRPDQIDPPKIEECITEDIFSVPSSSEIEVVDDESGAKGWKFRRQLTVPNSLHKCRLSVDPTPSRRFHPLVTIRHYISFVVALRNPDGHISEIRANVPIELVLLQNQRLDDRHVLESDPETTTNENEELLALDSGPPPFYGEHEADPTIDPRSVPPSGLASPARAFGSRQGSSQNLSHLLQDEQLFTNTIHNRLANILPSAAGRSIAGLTRSQNHSTAPSEEPSRSNSVDSIASETISPRTPGPHIEFTAEALSRCPSYNTAQSSAGVSGLDSRPQTYKQVTSRPPSPGISGLGERGERVRVVRWGEGTRD